MDIVKVLIEFIVTFVIIYLLYYVFIIRKCKKNRELMPTEVTLILSYYDIDINKIDLFQMIKVVSLVTTCILAMIITVISIFFDSTIILLIFGTLLSILVAIIFYRIIGKHYEKISKSKNSNKKNKKK